MNQRDRTFWSGEAEKSLRIYRAKCVALENLRDDIRECEESLGSIRSADPDCVRVKSSSTPNNQFLNALTMQDALTESYQRTKSWVEKMDNAFSVLSHEEITILERMYIYPEPNAVDRLAGDLQIDVKTVYRRKDAALARFTIARFGNIEN